MASTTISTLIFFSFLLALISAAPADVCEDTRYPSFCRAMLPIGNSSANIYDYGRFAILRSISIATKFSDLIDKYLKDSAFLTPDATSALEDCRYLARENVDFLETSYQTINTTQTLIPANKSEEIQTLLSAILTNTDTCIDGLAAFTDSWILKNGIVSPLQTDNQLYSLALSFFNRAWGGKNQTALPENKHIGFENCQMPPFKMSNKSTAVFETAGRRRLLQGGDQVVISDVVVVSQDGSGNFTTVTDAVNFAPNNSDAAAGYFLVYVKAGVYEEYVNIPKKKVNLMMIGDGINRTVITGNHSVADGWTTFNSATFIVVAPNFVAVNLTIRNTAGAIKHQAVALRNGADLSAFYCCSFDGYQDTLYTHSLRQFYRECDIHGTVDFIFGNAAVVLQNCNLYPRLPMAKQFNTITAQGRTDPGQNTGTSIQKCNIRAANDLAASDGTTETYLGRPWKEYSRTIYMQSYMDSLIAPVGWAAWSGDFALNTSYYAEFNNSGPGSNTSQRVNWTAFHTIDASDAVKFTASVFLLADYFLPQTGVPYDNGL